ncbi:class I SAM-dependent methyltransferase [Myxococcus landrumensis]|uniref:Class I SAM-dependent methyltransferase n=1 Tax=Myxococcus landrumensis TaxID=2813577 RepID=A0ABX7N8M6_9BACT|nr:class I SAM-dependent methyltransferase [Myxococcus landrumus]QSQ14005.1 class I SAM-dependent methyltransferase [Myxococcus landrumus]
MSEQFDNIGSKYEEFKTTTPLPIPERHTFQRLVGNLAGKRVLDLACGSGHYSRFLNRLGAEWVEGVDISPEMIQLARELEQKQPVGLRYHVMDARELSRLGDYDLVTAVFLLNYAQTREELRDMCRGAFSNLKPGGRFVAVTANPVFDLHRSNFSAYGVRVLSEQFEQGRHHCRALFLTEPPTPFEYFRWSSDVYESAFADAGFRNVTWHPIEIPKEAIDQFGDDFWREYRENSLVIGVSGQKAAPR